MGKQIAIDGPAGAGKSTIAKRLSAEKGFIYVDTGAMYRAVALYFIKSGKDFHDEAVVEKSLPDINIELKYVDGSQRVLLNGEDVSTQIRKEEVGNAASVTSVYPPVRSYLTALQKKLAEENNVVMDGRDIGTVVLPRAQAKIYLTASVETRARRRFDELTAKGEMPVLSEIEDDIRDRDYRDMHRETAPLKQADDAVLLDSSNLTIEEVVAEMKKICAEKGV
ncbi:MAG: (d)CMP kinase [Lachnospiraceae bacterium]|nr:(d)CMP kinase [Lachnospiraceae bacterium]